METSSRLADEFRVKKETAESVEPAEVDKRPERPFNRAVRLSGDLCSRTEKHFDSRNEKYTSETRTSDWFITDLFGDDGVVQAQLSIDVPYAFWQGLHWGNSNRTVKVNLRIADPSGEFYTKADEGVIKYSEYWHNRYNDPSYAEDREVVGQDGRAILPDTPEWQDQQEILDQFERFAAIAKAGTLAVASS